MSRVEVNLGDRDTSGDALIIKSVLAHARAGDAIVFNVGGGKPVTSETSKPIDPSCANEVLETRTADDVEHMLERKNDAIVAATAQQPVTAIASVEASKNRAKRIVDAFVEFREWRRSVNEFGREVLIDVILRGGLDVILQNLM
jgi:hypothetical protein